MNCIFKIQSLLAVFILFQCSLSEAMDRFNKDWMEYPAAPHPSKEQEIEKFFTDFGIGYKTKQIRQPDGLYIWVQKNKKTAKVCYSIKDYQYNISIPEDEEKKLYNELKRLYKSQQVSKNIQVQSNQFNFPKIEEVD